MTLMHTQGLASSMQHQTLFSIFSPDQLPLYKQILDNTHNGTVPIDMAELPNTHDILFITQTTLGLLSTKGIVFMDIYNPGALHFCRGRVRLSRGCLQAIAGPPTPSFASKVSLDPWAAYALLAVRLIPASALRSSARA